MLTVNKQESGTPPKTIAMHVSQANSTVVYTVPAGRKFSGTVSSYASLSYQLYIKPANTQIIGAINAVGGQYTPAYPIPIMLNAGDSCLSAGNTAGTQCFLLGVEEDA